MPFFLLSIIIQVCLVVHIIKTGRSTTWIWLVVILPLAGSIAYIVLEVLPDLGGTRTGRKASRKLQEIVNPHKDVKQAAYDYSISSSIENARRLADALLEKEQFEESRDLYRKSLRGIHEHDPHIMFGLARAEFGLKNYGETKRVLDALIAQNPDYKNADAHLLYARALELTKDTNAALHEYAVLDEYYPGPEASYHYAKLLQELGEFDKSQALFQKILNKAKTSGNHYKDLHSAWIKLAKAEMR